MHLLKRAFILLIGGIFCANFASAQLDQLGQIHGNFEINSQYYRNDTAISAVVPPQKNALWGFGNLIFTHDKFSAGVRYETYLPGPVGYPAGKQWSGAGIGYRYARYAGKDLDVTVGNFYEQFGNGLVLRTWEDRGLGVDYSLDGVRVKGSPYKGIYLKGLYGKQRYYFQDKNVYGPGIVRGVDGEINLSETFDSLFQGHSQWILGGSFVSKYQENTSSIFNYPQNTGATSARLTYINRGFRFSGEYAQISQNPSAQNSQLVNIPDTLNPSVGLWQKGQGMLFDASYSRRGFGISAKASSLGNMAFQSDRSAGPFDLWINYLPPTTVLQTSLLSQFYPYATQPNGEVGYRGEVFYTSKLGGKYKTKFIFGFTKVMAPDTTTINDLTTSRKGVKIAMFQTRSEEYYQEINLKIHHKFSHSFEGSVMYQNIEYNNDVLKGAYDYNNIPTHGMVYANIVVFEGSIRLNEKNNLRVELQDLHTKQHLQDWAAGVLEYTISPNWFFSVVDQWNYGNNDSKTRYHFPLVSAGFIKDASRLTVSYGRQRAGVFCVGGVCRVVPASSGLTVSITTSF